MFDNNFANIFFFLILCCTASFTFTSPIDDGSYMDDDRRISRRYDSMPRFENEVAMFKSSEPKASSFEDKSFPKQARNTESKVDPSFVLSKFLYHMAQLPSV